MSERPALYAARADRSGEANEPDGWERHTRDHHPGESGAPTFCPHCGIHWQSTDLRRPSSDPRHWRCSDCGAEWIMVDRPIADPRETVDVTV